MKNKIILKIAIVSFGLFFTNLVFADTTIHLQVKTNTSSIYDGDVTVTPCDSKGDGVLSSTPYCALVKSGTASDWAGLWVNSIGGVLNNDGGNGVYWMWLSNLSIDNCPTCSYSLSGKEYILQNNDKILFYYNTNPLDITVDNENPKVGEKIKIKGKELGLDSSWNPVWSNASLGKALINGTPHDLDANGEFVYEVINNDALSVKIQKDGFIDSKELNIKPEEVRSSGSSGSYIANFIKTTIAPRTFSKEDALKFLENNQKIDGSFGDSLYTDWVAVGVAKEGNELVKEKLIKYYKENNLETSLLTDYERRAMALMALGINPYVDTKVNYIEKIVDSFDGEQFGDKTLLNDDIFALIVLKNAGYSNTDEMIIKDVNYIISKQAEDGSFGSVDITAAAVQALRGFEGVRGVRDGISKGESYIILKQEKDFGFGNSFSTTWVLQSLYNNEKVLKAEAYLVSKQEVDGGIENVGTDLNTRIWVTAYAIPAISHKPWNIILNNFPQLDIKVNDSVKNDLVKQKAVYKKINKQDGVIIKSTEDKNKIENIVDNNGEVKVNKSSNIWHVLGAPFSWLLGKLGF